MLAVLKNYILKIFFLLCKVLTQLRGVTISKGCIINRVPYIRKCKGSQIILGDCVTLTSNKRHNPLLQHAVQLRTLTPQAVIEMKPHSGMSGSSIVCASKISIGEYTIIGPGSLIYDSDGHDYSPEVGWSMRSVRTGRPINIGAKCFIGTRCIIMSGVTIGNNCVVSAGSVVTQNVPDGHIASGNPATSVPLPRILGGPGRKQKGNLKLDK